MKKVSILYFIVPVIMGVLCYLSSNNIFVSLGVLAVSLMYFLVLFMNRFYKYRLNNDRFRSCYNFVNNFIITLSIKLTLSGALESVTSSMNDEFKEDYQGIEHLTDMEKLKYLKKYFPFHVYELFLNIVSLYEERGGNILDMSSYLLEELRNQNEYLIKTSSMAIRKWVEFAILWFLSLAILVLLRFALSQFFMKISTQLFYQISLSAIFLFVLVSIEILARKAFSINMKGWTSKDE